MFSLNNHSLFHRHNNVLFYKSAICLSGFILRCTIHLEVLFILIGAGVNTWVTHKCSIYNVLFIFFIALTKHLTKYHEGGETDCDFRGPQSMMVGKTGRTAWCVVVDLIPVISVHGCGAESRTFGLLLSIKHLATKRLCFKS